MRGTADGGSHSSGEWSLGGEHHEGQVRPFRGPRTAHLITGGSEILGRVVAHPSETKQDPMRLLGMEAFLGHPFLICGT